MIRSLIFGGLKGRATEYAIGGNYGTFWNTILKASGGIVGTFLFSLAGFSVAGVIGQIISATIGSYLLASLLGFLNVRPVAQAQVAN